MSKKMEAIKAYESIINKHKMYYAFFEPKILSLAEEMADRPAELETFTDALITSLEEMGKKISSMELDVKLLRINAQVEYDLNTRQGIRDLNSTVAHLRSELDQRYERYSKALAVWKKKLA